MQIHRFRGRTLHDALIRARDRYGDGAVVVGHEAAPDGGVTVAVAEAGLAALRIRRRGAGAGARTAVPAPRPEGADPGVAEVRRRLERAGASSELVARVARSVERSGAGGAYAIDVAARFLGARFAIEPSPKLRGGTRVLAFVGPTGVGKSTTVAKLAARLTAAGRGVAIATSDVERPGGTALLREVAAELGVPLEEAPDAKALAGALRHRSGADVLLLDTAGRSPLDTAGVRGLGRVLERTSGSASLTTYLVLPATSRKEALDEALRGFAACEPDACVVTKLDETERAAPVLEFVAFHELRIAFLCDGQDRGRHLHRPKAAHFADLLLRGRLA